MSHQSVDTRAYLDFIVIFTFFLVHSEIGKSDIEVGDIEIDS